MRPCNPPNPSVATLVADWLALTGWFLRAGAARVDDLLEGAADDTRDTILDLELGGQHGDRPKAGALQPLPPLDPEELLAALHGQAEDVVRRAAQVINEDPYGCWAAVTEERVLALFNDLGRQVLARALDLRVSGAEAGRSPPGLPRGEWARRYRRMSAGEGRWPPAPGADPLPPQRGPGPYPTPASPGPAR